MDYLLLIKGSFEKWDNMAPAKRTEVMKQFGAYAAKLKELKYIRWGDGCGERAFRLMSPSASAEESLVAPDTPDMVTGYFLLHTPGEKEALEAARLCPAFGCGEYVELIPCGE